MEMDEGRINRRGFLKAGAAAAAVSAIPFVQTSRTAAAQPLKVGLIGCGGRGTASMREALMAEPDIEVHALYDPFQDRIDRTLERLNSPKYMGKLKPVQVPKERQFSGLEGHKELLQTDIDWVNLVGPPGFRPRHFAAAVEAGKNVFLEKPVAVDPAGVRRILATAKKAKAKGLSVVVGFDSRHLPNRSGAVKRIHEGAIGDIVYGTSYNYTSWVRWYNGYDPSWSEMEYQCRNWYYFCWLSGDVIVEQSIHRIDINNWVMDAYPVSALGQGGRQLPLDPIKGNIWDHFSIDYEYPGGVHVYHMDRQWPECDPSGKSGFVGTKGQFNGQDELTGQNPWKYKGELERAGVFEQRAMISSLREGKPRAEGENGAYSALTGIMGRESAYTGKLVTWDEILKSDLDLFPEKVEFGPVRQRAVPIPGEPRPI
jgi:predicted dehydrogenase